MKKPKLPPAVVDHEAGTVTFAVTFKWNKPWAMDHCEVIALGRGLRMAIEKELGDWEQLHSLAGVQSWEPNEEVHTGAYHGAPIKVPLYGARQERQEPCSPECSS